jgi:predicted metal-binding membrane protein
MTMPMLWMPMPGQSWLAAAASFVAAWVVMMVAMMLPSLVPMLWRYRQAIAGDGGTRLARLTALVGVGYLFVWTVCGLVVFPIGLAVAAIARSQPALASLAPMAAGAVVLIAGILQYSAWKARHLAFCRGEPRSVGIAPPQFSVVGRGVVGKESSRRIPADSTHDRMTQDRVQRTGVARSRLAAGLPLFRRAPTAHAAAWRHGLCLGLHCCQSCACFTAVALVIGIMDLRVMAVLMVAITAERLAPSGALVARATGGGLVGAGLFLMAHAAVLV